MTTGKMLHVDHGRNLPAAAHCHVCGSSFCLRLVEGRFACRDPKRCEERRNLLLLWELEDAALSLP